MTSSIFFRGASMRVGALQAFAQYYGNGPGGWREPPRDDEWQEPDDHERPPPRR